MGYFINNRGSKRWDGIGEPELGDETTGDILNLTGTLYRFALCPSCNKKRWVQKQSIKNLITNEHRCGKCATLFLIEFGIEKKRIPGTCADINNPQHWETARWWQLGKKRNDLYVYKICKKCGNSKWLIAEIVNGEILLKAKKYKKIQYPCPNDLCVTCFHETRSKEYNANWTGGKTITKKGYIVISIYPEDPIYSLLNHKPKYNTKTKKVLEHIYVMTMHLGRPLELGEEVHHKIDPLTGVANKLDNRIENLQLIDKRTHKTISHAQQIILRKNKEIEELKKQLEVAHRQTNVVNTHDSKILVESKNTKNFREEFPNEEKPMVGIFAYK